MEFIKNIENNLWKLPTESRTRIREQSKSIIKNIPTFSYPKTLQNEWLTRSLWTTKSFLHSNKDLILTRADKDNVTVALDKTDYLSKVEDLLRDRNTYTVVKKDSTKKLISNLIHIQLLKKIQQKN